VSLCGETAKYHDLEAIIAMALDQSALLEMLDALRNADASDRIRQAADRHARRVDDRSWRLRPSRKLAKRTITGTLNCRVCGEGMRHALLRDACLAEHRDYAETPTPQSYFGALETVSLLGERVVAVVIAQPGGECTARPGRCRPDRCRPDRSMRCASKNGPPYRRR
jgi:hypothetical protein